MDFYIGSLGATLDYKLPVEVFVRGNKWSRYTTSDSQILIFKEHVNEDHPKRGFLEAHEFSHHVMYDLYGRWPEGDDMLEMENHAGYINPSTADSYIEGFAEFMPMVLRDYTGEANPHIYSDFGSLEVNYRTSSRRGRLEEFAVAGVLWDLYDKNDDRGDTISMTLPDIWSIISIKRKDFYEYYKAFVDTFPEKKAQIDAVFIEHGFFEDKNPGNGKWDYVEPFKDANNNGVYDAGEAFVDYGSASGLPAAMFYDTGETIGKATDYTRLPRSLEVYYPGAYLKVSETDALLYTVSVDLADPQDGQDYSYTTGQAEGLIYIMPLPDHIEATITVAPKEYSAQSTYTIINSEYSEKLYASDKGYFDEHTFGLSGSGMILEDGEEWGFDFDGGYTGTEVLQVGSSEIDVSPIEEDQATQQAAGGEFPWLIIIVILLIAGAAFIFMKRRPVGIPVSTPQTVAPTHSGPSKFCHICGRRIEPGQKYCRECGSSSQ